MYTRAYARDTALQLRDAGADRTCVRDAVKRTCFFRQNVALTSEVAG
jgi:hypothetical protein